MTRKIYLETLKSVLGRSIIDYCLQRTKMRSLEFDLLTYIILKRKMREGLFQTKYFWKIYKKTFWPFSMKRIQLSELLQVGSLLLTIKSPGFEFLALIGLISTKTPLNGFESNVYLGKLSVASWRAWVLRVKEKLKLRVFIRLI